REPVDAADPAVAVRRVPADRAQDAFFPRDARRPAGFGGELVVADAQRHHVGDAGAETSFVDDDVAIAAPEAVLLAGLQDQLAPVAHRDVLALAVDVVVARDAL